MKIAITGKGGVGKTTLAAILSHLYASEGKKVMAVDADPDTNLALALGVPDDDIQGIKPLTDMSELIEERTRTKTGSMGGMFKLNPRVHDLPDGIGYHMDGITLLIMGKLKPASSGCYCPEHILLKTLLKHLIIDRSEVVIVDMEAGIEHMTRGTAESVDAFIVVVEPGRRSLQTAKTVADMATSIGIREVFVVANKIRSPDELAFIKRHTGSLAVIGSIGFHAAVLEADMNGQSPFAHSPETVQEVMQIKEEIARRLHYEN